jgi:hypothetical protein
MGRSHDPEAWSATLPVANAATASSARSWANGDGDRPSRIRSTRSSSALIVHALLGGPLRFGDLRSSLGGIAPNVLSQRLSQLREPIFLEKADLLGSTLQRLQSFTALKVGHVYDKGLRGYSATMPKGLVKKLLADPQVKYVEPDQQVTGNVQTFPWGVNAVQADLSYARAGNGSGCPALKALYSALNSLISTPCDHPSETMWCIVTSST